MSTKMSRPRLTVYRSLRDIYAQIVDDSKGQTLAGVSSLKTDGSLTKKAEFVGREIAKLAKEKKIPAVSFDRGNFAYAGAVKVLCETARQEGLTI